MLLFDQLMPCILLLNTRSLEVRELASSYTTIGIGEFVNDAQTDFVGRTCATICCSSMWKRESSRSWTTRARSAEIASLRSQPRSSLALTFLVGLATRERDVCWAHGRSRGGRRGGQRWPSATSWLASCTRNSGGVPNVSLLGRAHHLLHPGDLRRDGDHGRHLLGFWSKVVVVAVAAGRTVLVSIHGTGRRDVYTDRKRRRARCSFWGWRWPSG